MTDDPHSLQADYPSPGPGATTTSSTTGSQAIAPPVLARRSSYEPMRLGALPPPNFSKAPPGQRSVPAVAGNANISDGVDGGSSTLLGSGANTPTLVPLGNGAMSSEPWNLWTDPSVPGNLKSTDDDLAARLANSHILGHTSPARNADATGHHLGAKTLSRASSLRKSSAPPGSGSGHGSGSPSTAWPEEFANAKTAAHQSFALDTNAAAVAATAASSIPPGSNAAATSPATSTASLNAADAVDRSGASSSLLPRNVSFSSMLDLPALANPANTSSGAQATSAPGTGPASPKNVKLESAVQSTTNGSAGQLGRSASLGRTVVEQPPSGGQCPDHDALSLPSLAFTVSSSLDGSTAASAAPNGNAVNPYSTASARQNATSSPVQSIDAMAAAAFANPGNRYGMSGNGDSNGFGGAGRARQTSAATTYSDASSITSLPFGPALYASLSPSHGPMPGHRHEPGHQSQQQQHGPLDPFGAGASTDVSAFSSPFPGLSSGASVFGNSYSSSRRDSGYGISPYNTLGYQGNRRHAPAQNAWQMSPFTSPMMGRTAFGDTGAGPFTAPGSGFGNGSPYEPSLMGLASPPSQNGSVSSSLYRHGSTAGLGAEFGGHLHGLGHGHGLGVQQNYGLGLVGPASPFTQLGGGYYEYRQREDRSKPIRSPLLEEFRADKLRRWGVTDMLGHIAEFMTDQVGSRYIQEFILENPTTLECDAIYEEVFPVILQLSVDVFANFCVQRLLEKASEDQVANMAHGLKGSILRLALQTYGCRVIQKTIEVVSPETQIIILRELEGSVQKCVRDQNANHVIQKIIQTVPADQLQFIVDAFSGHVYTFATHPYSCRVLQRILENCPDRMTRPLLEELKSYSQNLMQDQYGNYVVQFVLEKGLPQDKSDIIQQIYGQVLHLSKHKFASNVIEKCIMNANEGEIHYLASEVLAPRFDGTTGVLSMLKHEYANYPLQRLIKHTIGPVHHAIVEQVSHQLTMFRCANPPFTAKHLVAVEKLLLDISPDGFPTLMPRRFEDHYVPRLR